MTPELQQELDRADGIRDEIHELIAGDYHDTDNLLMLR